MSLTLPSRALGPGLLLLLGLAACRTEPVGSANLPPECWDLWECNGDRLCGRMVDCVEGRCRDDLPLVVVDCPGDECLEDADCVVAEAMSCCIGCPLVTSRQQMLDEMPCYAETGEVVDPIPEGCRMECSRCPTCFPRPWAARCDLGRCVATDVGCPPETDGGNPPVAEVAAILASPASYDGGTYRVTGALLPTSGICDMDCPSDRCCDWALAVDGVLRLTGKPCGIDVIQFGDAACDGDLHGDGLKAGATYEISGPLRYQPGTWPPFTLTAESVRLVPPRGVEGVYTVALTSVVDDNPDPICTPSPLRVGQVGRLFLAGSGVGLRAAAPLLDCHWDLAGTVDASGFFEARVPIDCDDCCCDFTVNGQVVGDLVWAEYGSYDGHCTVSALLSGERERTP